MKKIKFKILFNTIVICTVIFSSCASKLDSENKVNHNRSISNDYKHREDFLEAVKNDGKSLQFADESLQNDPKILKACKNINN